MRGDRALERRVARARGELTHAAGAIRPATLERRLEAGRRRLADVGRLIDSLNPDRILERGYARVEAAEGGTVTTADAARAAGALSLRFRDGAVAVQVDGSPRRGPTVEPEVEPKVERSPRRAYPDKPEQPRLI